MTSSSLSRKLSPSQMRPQGACWLLKVPFVVTCSLLFPPYAGEPNRSEALSLLRARSGARGFLQVFVAADLQVGLRCAAMQHRADLKVGRYKHPALSYCSRTYSRRSM